MAALTAATILAPMVGAAAQANEPPLWQTEIAKIPSTTYSRDALHYMTEATEALRPWVGEDGLDESRLEPVLEDVGTRYYDGARFTSRADAEAAFDNLTHFEAFLKSRMTGASPPNGDAEIGHVNALIGSMTGLRLLADAAIQDAEATIGPFRSPDLPADIEVPAGMDAAFALLDGAEADLAKADEMFLKANVEPATINVSRSWGNGFAVLETFGITYDGDHDEDGLQDVLELMFGSSPLLGDSDFDGLTDAFEITQLAGWTWPADPDSDDDGVRDGDEDIDEDGLTNLQEQELGTSPTNPDTDGDGASDGDEVANGTNPLVKDQPVQVPVPPDGDLPPITPVPAEGDADGDGVGDFDEADDYQSDPQSADSDGDGLGDGYELEIGTSLTSGDTDSDGLSDGYEVQHIEEGIDPRVHDVRLSKWDYIGDFLLGMFVGDFEPRESIAWLAGNLCTVAASFIPVVGWIIGAVADVRDAIANVINGEWVGVGLSLVGVVPYVGDVVSIAAKIMRWVRGFSAFGTLGVNASRLTEGYLQWIQRGDVPNFLKVELLQLVMGSTLDTLRRFGFNNDQILALARNRGMDLEKLAAQVSSPLSRVSDDAPWIRLARNPANPTDRILPSKMGEWWVAINTASRSGRPAIPEFPVPGVSRRVDVAEDLGNGRYIAHEVKTGFTDPRRLDHNLQQCRIDGELMRAGRQGQGVIADVVWHFLPANNALGDGDLNGRTLGVHDELFNCLVAEGIPFIFHKPDMNASPWPGD